jgi:hypothetical protein
MKSLRIIVLLLLLAALIAVFLAMPTNAQVGLSISLACAILLSAGILLQSRKEI